MSKFVIHYSINQIEIKIISLLKYFDYVISYKDHTLYTEQIYFYF